ncbi:MAG: nitrilase family protein [Flavobacteriaceae bacterium]|nr:nitrilase family protein [Flavobacteriaceae bacterium]
MNTKIKVALIQTSLNWEETKKNLLKYDSMVEQIEEKTNVVFFPEMFNTGFSMNVKKIYETMNGESVTWLKEIASKKNLAAVASLAIKENDKFYNRLVWAHPSGEINYYDKRHTFTLAGESEVYSKGKTNQVINFMGWRFLPQICYDLRFPVWSRNKMNYDVLFYIANWPMPRISHWNKLLAARAIENMSYCIGVNIVGKDPGNKYTGDSCVINPSGELCTKKSDKETIIYCELNKNTVNDYRKNLKFLDDMDDFIINI